MVGKRSAAGGSPREAAQGPAYAVLAARLRDRIVSGELQPGDQLPTELEVSAQFQVSRNTAREAIRILASQGLVATRRGATGGNFVAHPTPEAIRDNLHTGLELLTASRLISLADLIDARAALEVPVAERAALRRDEVDLAALREAAALPARPSDDSAYVHHRDFHALLARASRNPLYGVLAEPLFRIPLAERYTLRDKRMAHWRQVESDHHQILAAVEQGDPIGAREATRAHLHHLRAAYLDPTAEG